MDISIERVPSREEPMRWDPPLPRSISRLRRDLVNTLENILRIFRNLANASRSREYFEISWKYLEIFGTRVKNTLKRYEYFEILRTRRDLENISRSRGISRNFPN